MPDVIQLSCASCGAKLKITDDIDRFACSSCGAEFLVRRGDGIVSLQPVVQGLSEILVENKRISSELALARLRAEIDELQAEMNVLRNDGEKEALALLRPIQRQRDVVMWTWFAMGAGVVLLLARSWIGAIVLLGGFVLWWVMYRELRQLKQKRESVLATYDAGIAECQAEITAKQQEVNTLLKGLSYKPNGRA